MIKQHNAATQKEAGFTIVELMVATLVFSVILLVITVGVLSFTNAYYKGINASTTQDTTRTAINTIAQAIQFAGVEQDIAPLPFPSPNPTVPQVFCAGNKQFTYTLGVQVSSTTPGLYVAPLSGSGCPSQPTLPVSGGTELLGPHMRLVRIDINSLGSARGITLRVAYGDNDLLCDTQTPATASGGCATGFDTTQNNKVTGDTIICRSQTGSQFCSVSSLSTTVEQRAVAP